MMHPSPRIRRAALLAGVPLFLAAASCEPSDYLPCGQGTEIPLTQAWLIFQADLAANQSCSWPLVMSGGAPTDVKVPTLAQLALVEGKATLQLDAYEEVEPGWIPTHAYAPGGHVIQVRAQEAGPVLLKFTVLGPENGVSPDWSLNLTDPRLTDDSMIGQMGNLMATVADDSHGGRLLAQWLEAFGDAAVGARTGPVDLLAYLKATYGADPASWAMSQLPFVTTSIQNRIDLIDASSCGEVRVAVAVTASPYENMSFLFRFRQPPGALDRSPSGAVYCDELARRWVSMLTLAGQDPDQWFTQVNSLLQDALARSNFVAAQTSEAIGTSGNWEFREWVTIPNPDIATQAQLPKIMATHPLPMTVDTPRLNAAGADRDAFLAFVEGNAAGLNARTVAIPDVDLPQTAQATETAWTPLDLTGVSPATLAAYPDLRKEIEVVGCTGCHVTASGMRHSRPSQNASGFLTDELVGRATFLRALQRGERPARGFDPLASTALPP